MRRIRSLDPVLAAGTLLSVGLAVLFYLYTELAPAIATFAALLGGIMTLQIESYVRDRRRDEREDRIERYPWLSEAIDEIADSTAQIEEKYAGTVAERECIRIFEDAKLRLTRLKGGHFHGHFEDHSPATELIENATKSMKATSVVRADLSFWLSAKSRPYWAAQVYAMERGVTIRRVFVYHEWSDDLDRLARSQAAAGVQVRVIHESELGDERLKGIINIWDDRFGLRTSYALDNEPWGFDFILEEAELRELVKQFDQIEGMALTLDEVPAPHSA